ncbi:cytochrome b [Rhodalgimonas zhirmunskyi]|uniref:Cytochrome b/b6 domain-containing protein n=1 Tax=Rhodalgimonas zhirmunskyi TaxID=2964767 RepID=A0AAJ1U8K4_9RHOB|nr:cytochrome b/b6 domain-containing protein [Rhodoalgimonas zhirmunskyi]MDQ2094760.1 cytochrome b/b6 domain-containing protein [Rhodoalgimonas zhirmunskyi]
MAQTPARPYTRAQIMLHWLILALIVVQFVSSDGMSAAWRQLGRGAEPDLSLLFWVHLVMGSVILGLVVIRIGLRLRHGAPALPEDEPPALQWIARLTHLGLYALMLAMPVSGLVAWYGGVRAAGDAHEVLKALLLVLIGLHIAGALYQQFVLKTNIMARMKRPG